MFRDAAIAREVARKYHTVDRAEQTAEPDKGFLPP